MLAREFIRQGRDPEPVRLHVGTPIPFTRLKRFETDEELVGYLRVATYMLGNRPEPAPPEQIAEIAKAQAPEPVAERLPGERLQADVDALPPDALLLSQGELRVYIGPARGTARHHPRNWPRAGSELPRRWRWHSHGAGSRPTG